MQIQSNANIIFAFAGIAFVIISIIYWYKFEKPTRTIQSRREGLYFDPPEFRRRAVSQTFEWFTAKWNKNILYFIVLATASIIVPRFLLPDPYNFIISMVSCVVSFVIIMYLKELQDGIEVKEFSNKPVGTSITHYPDVGDNSELWRKMDNEGEVQLDEEQKKFVVDEIFETAKDLPSFSKIKHEFDDDEKAKNKKDKKYKVVKFETYIKALWTEKMNNMHTYRMRIDDDFRILLVSPHTIEEIKTQGTKNMIAKTIHIDLQQIPMFSIYTGVTRKIFASRDEKDRKCFIDKTMGMYIIQYSIKSRDDDMLTGKHTIMTKENALLAEAIHLVEQDHSTAKEMTKTLRDMEKANQDYDEADFDSKAESHRLSQGRKNMLDVMGAFSKQSRTKTDGLVVFLVGVVFTCVGVALGFTWGILAGLGVG